MSKSKKTTNGFSKDVSRFQTSPTDDVAKKIMQSPIDLTSVSPEKIMVNEDAANRIRNAEQAVLRAKLQLSEFEMSLADLSFKKQELVNQIRHENSKMLEIVREVAETHGIDPDGKNDDKKWNLNTNEMIFYRVQ